MNESFLISLSVASVALFTVLAIVYLLIAVVAAWICKTATPTSTYDAFDILAGLAWPITMAAVLVILLYLLVSKVIIAFMAKINP